MTPGDIILITGCLVIGYMTVSLFLRRGGKPDAREGSAPRAEAKAQAEPEDAAAAPPRPPHWSEVLGIAPAAGVDEIREAYRRRIAQCHPDKVATLDPELQALANAKTQEITTAYQDAIRERAG